MTLLMLLPFAALAQTIPPALSTEEILTETQRRAFRFFWEKSDPTTGLTNDRAKNRGEDDYTVASTASTGYALASLPIAVEHKWIGREEAYERALRTVRFLLEKMPHEHGWFYHFIEKHDGKRVWDCELSSIDTSLLLLGALLSGQYWKGTELEKKANALYDRVDWEWMRTNGGAKPDKLTISHGWKPESGFLPYEWDNYCELTLLYLLGLGAKKPLPANSWKAFTRNVVVYGEHKTLSGGPIFFHQMAYGYYDFRDQRDALGWDYWVSAREGIQINRQYCFDLIPKRKSYAPNIWGLNANDTPDGYGASEAPGHEDGTVSPTGAIAAIMAAPDLAKPAAQALYTHYGEKLWGRYGFGNAFNVDRDWYDPDVIGIDLGMALLAIENHRTGLPWKLIRTHPATQRAWKRAGFHRIREPQPRPLLRAPLKPQ